MPLASCATAARRIASAGSSGAAGSVGSSPMGSPSRRRRRQDNSPRIGHFLSQVVPMPAFGGRPRGADRLAHRSGRCELRLRVDAFVGEL